MNLGKRCYGVSAYQRGISERDFFGQPDCLELRHHDVLRVAARCFDTYLQAVQTESLAGFARLTLAASTQLGNVDVLSNATLVDTGAHRRYFAGRIYAHNQWQCCTVNGATGTSVAVESTVYRDCAHAYLNLTLSRLRCWYFFVSNNVRRTEIVHYACFHGEYCSTVTALVNLSKLHVIVCNLIISYQIIIVKE